MILGRPWALALLLVPPILLWLRLRAARPRAEEASSLLVWSRVAPADAPAARPRPPMSAWLEAAGAALLALGAADLAVPGPGASSARVLFDVSPSMKGRPAPAVPGPIEEAPDPERVLPGLLASGTPVVVVTDHRLPAFPDDPPRLQVIGIGAPAFNAGITAASGTPLADGRWRVFLTIEAHAATGPVEGMLRMGPHADAVTLQPGSPLECVREIAGEAAAARIEFAGDVQSLDDVVPLVRKGGAEVRVLRPETLAASPLVRALIAAGAVPGDLPEANLELRLATGEGASPGGELVLRLPENDDGPEVLGSDVTVSDHPLLRDVRIDPSVSVGRRVHVPVVGKIGMPLTTRIIPIPKGSPLLSDRDGPLASLTEEREGKPPEAEFVFLPGGTWVERDPSFVVFAKNLVEYVAGGPARLEATGVLDPEETRQAAEGETFGDLGAALEAARRPDPGRSHPLASILLLGGAGLLFAAWFASR